MEYVKYYLIRTIYTMVKYSVIIPTLWKSNRIGKLIFSLIECEFVDEIILIDNAGKFFEYFEALDKENLDAILSINNYHSAYSAVAEYPNITVPMGYKKSGEPISLTFIVKPKEESKLLILGNAPCSFSGHGVRENRSVHMT